ncbi:DUF523 domain-containing protein [Thalassotalea sp. M1531]|uniref:DUF523 domain-containing protein n=1 Tax=Thalassotalea algicola TaxID=2716224 RepID=A0A7Y0Q738_9GAMM|nr:DUF523 domain-containing protein [Thalassotalea algicola]NMP30635.1 DUF523 domain-containing protein [Thalassotalea algicola]
MEKILISACFLGLNVRYDGKAKALLNRTITDWRRQGRLIVVCPEVAGGLAVPREPAEINRDTGQVITQQGADVSAAFKSGAEHALYLCQQHNIRYALLKESSPSCGSSRVYDGTFSGKKIEGRGITAQLLEKHGIQVFSEQNFNDLVALFSVDANGV